MLTGNAGSFAPLLGVGGRASLAQAPGRTASGDSKQARRRLMRVTARILWIDDDESVLRFLQELLTRHGFVVDGATTGAKGLELGCSGVYDVIGLDLKLPDVPGIQIIRELRSRAIETPVFVLTGYFPDDALISSAWRAGAVECRAKPIRPGPLLEILDRIVRHRARPDARAARNSVASILVWLDSAESGRAGRTAHPGYRDFVEHLQARLLAAIVEPAITIPALHGFARAFARTLATPTDASWATLTRDVRRLLQRAVLVSPVHPAVALAIARFEALPTMAPGLSEADLATEAVMAPSHLGRQLFQDTGMGFRTWQRIGRVRAAVRELAASHEHVKQVAVGTHWSSHSRLDRDFHSLFGISPTEFRRRLAAARTLMRSLDNTGGAPLD
jgi:DNA-binding response OmpR family regulator